MRKHIASFRSGVAPYIRNYGTIIVLATGFVAVGVLCFASGFLFGRERQLEPLVIEKAVEPCIAAGSAVKDNAGVSGKDTDNSSADSKNTSKTEGTENKTASSTETNASKNCIFVGSKNSDKYHLPTCAWAKRIKPENIVCFSSAADAEAKGYKPGCVE